MDDQEVLHDRLLPHRGFGSRELEGGRRSRIMPPTPFWGGGVFFCGWVRGWCCVWVGGGWGGGGRGGEEEGGERWCGGDGGGGGSDGAVTTQCLSITPHACI